MTYPSLETMTASSLSLLSLLLAWLIYFILHSALAALTVKHWIAAHWPRLSPHYRLVYNVAACLFLIPILWLLSATPLAPLWSWQGAWRWASDGAAVVAVAMFYWSLRYYDVREFLGLRQSHTPQEHRRFVLSPLHRFVRHPWYFLALVIIWTRDMDPAWLVSCAAITLYFAIGSRLEERKLVREFGEIYRRYQRRVPGLIPLPGRYLSQAEAGEIVTSANQTLG